MWHCWCAPARSLHEQLHQLVPWWCRAAPSCSISEFHSEVSRMLSAMGVEHTIEHLTDDHLFSGKGRGLRW